MNAVRMDTLRKFLNKEIEKLKLPVILSQQDITGVDGVVIKSKTKIK